MGSGGTTPIPRPATRTMSSSTGTSAVISAKRISTTRAVELDDALPLRVSHAEASESVARARRATAGGGGGGEAGA